MKRNFFDRTIEVIAPGYALKRYASQVRLNVAIKNIDKIENSQQRKYDGAARKGYRDWYSPNLSVNQEVQTSLAILRDRSRDLARNNPYAINAVRSITNNVIGTGIIPTPKGIRPNQVKLIKNLWDKWGVDSTDADFEGNNTIYGLQRLVLKTVAESGECLIRKVRGSSTDIVPLRLQLLEGDFINTGIHTGIYQADGTITYYGIKFGKDGKRLGYWLYKHHPNEFGADTEFVPAEDIIHIYDVERAGQIRGVPFSCGVMLRLRDLDDYEFTERTRAKIAASFAVFIKEDQPQEENTTNENHLKVIEPGTINYLTPGQEIQVANPPTSQGFGDFSKANLRGIAAGFGTTYESLSGDYSMVNFSSGRMGWLESSRYFEHLQWNLMVPRFCNKVFKWFIESVQLMGVLPANVNPSVTWTPPRREMIDPMKEIQAIKAQLRLGIISWQEVVRQFGQIPEELMEELKADKEMFEKLGIMTDGDPRFDSNRPPDEVEESDPSIKKDE